MPKLQLVVLLLVVVRCLLRPVVVLLPKLLLVVLLLVVVRCLLRPVVVLLPKALLVVLLLVVVRCQLRPVVVLLPKVLLVVVRCLLRRVVVLFAIILLRVLMKYLLRPLVTALPVLIIAFVVVAVLLHGVVVTGVRAPLLWEAGGVVLRRAVVAAVLKPAAIRQVSRRSVVPQHQLAEQRAGRAGVPAWCVHGGRQHEVGVLEGPYRLPHTKG